jgi:hypothetical protein
MRKVVFVLLLYIIAIPVGARFISSIQQGKLIRPVPTQTSSKPQGKKLAKVVKPTSTPTPIPTKEPTPEPTAVPTPKPTLTPAPVVAPADLDPLFSKYSSEYSIDKQQLMRIAKCESGFGTGASANGYGGLYQFSETLWVQTRTLMGQNPDPQLRYSGEEAIRTAAFMLWQHHTGIWPNCK